MSELHGILNVTKPAEWTSMDVVRRIKRLTRQKKVGHAGTLDPQATGVLPICFGQATRVMEYLVDSPKTYRATVQFGVSTDTYDSQGQVTEVKDPSHVTEEDILRELEAFRGTFPQVPPMFSALKHEGQRLYKLAREGQEVVREPRNVEMYRLEIRGWEPPNLDIEMDCGRGMYVRSLAFDLGAALGCGAHLTKLCRLQAGPFHISTASTMESMEELCQDDSWESLLFPVDYPLLNLRAAVVQREKEDAIRRGQGIYLGMPSKPVSAGDLCRLYSWDGEFIGLVRPGRARGLWQVQKVFKLRSGNR